MPDVETLLYKCPRRAHTLGVLQQTLAQQTDQNGFDVKTLSATLSTDMNQKTLMLQSHSSIAQNIMASADVVERHILASQAGSHTGAHLQPPPMQEYAADDNVFSVSVARRLRLPHPAVAHPSQMATHCPNMAASRLVCGTQLDLMLNHCVTCAKGGGVVQRHDAVVRCLAKLIQKYKNTQARVEQWVPTMQRTTQGGQARPDDVFFDNACPADLAVAIVALYSADPALMTSAAANAGYMARRAERNKFSRYPGHKLIPFVLETTGRLGYHTRQFIQHLAADHEPQSVVVSEIWACIQGVLHGCASQQQLAAAQGTG